MVEEVPGEGHTFVMEMEVGGAGLGDCRGLFLGMDF